MGRPRTLDRQLGEFARSPVSKFVAGISDAPTRQSRRRCPKTARSSLTDSSGRQSRHRLSSEANRLDDHAGRHVIAKCMQQENDRGPRHQPNTGTDAPPNGHGSAYMTAAMADRAHAVFLGVLGVVTGTRDVVGPQWFDVLLTAACVAAPTDESLQIA